MEERFRYCIKQNFKKFKKIKILEIGSGSGEFLKLLHKGKINYKGIEVDPRQQIREKYKFKRNNILLMMKKIMPTI